MNKKERRQQFLQREIIKLIVEKGPLTKEEIITEIQKRFNK